ncbi:ATP-binding cassette domain-containing protein [Streptococcus gallolyticus]
MVKLKEMGKIVIIVEHRLYYLKELTNQLIVIKDKKVTSYPAIDITDDFTQTQNLRQLNEISKTELIESLPYQKHSKKSQTLPESSDLICQNYRYKHRDNKDNIFDFNLGLDKGINFIIGKNGVGKTTFLRCLSGLNKTFKGQTFYEKQPVKPTDEKVKKDALTQFGLIDKIERHPQSLSGGKKQRLLLAMAKASNKTIIVLDEPTSGLCRLQVERMIEDLHDMAQTGKLIIIVTHDYELIKNCSGNIIEFVE